MLSVIDGAHCSKHDRHREQEYDTRVEITGAKKEIRGQTIQESKGERKEGKEKKMTKRENKTQNQAKHY